MRIQHDIAGYPCLRQKRHSFDFAGDTRLRQPEQRRLTQFCWLRAEPMFARGIHTQLKSGLLRIFAAERIDQIGQHPGQFPGHQGEVEVEHLVC